MGHQAQFLHTFINSHVYTSTRLHVNTLLMSDSLKFLNPFRTEAYVSGYSADDIYGILNDSIENSAAINSAWSSKPRYFGRADEYSISLTRVGSFSPFGFATHVEGGLEEHVGKVYVTLMFRPGIFVLVLMFLVFTGGLLGMMMFYDYFGATISKILLFVFGTFAYLQYQMYNSRQELMNMLQLTPTDPHLIGKPSLYGYTFRPLHPEPPEEEISADSDSVEDVIEDEQPSAAPASKEKDRRMLKEERKGRYLK